MAKAKVVKKEKIVKNKELEFIISIKIKNSRMPQRIDPDCGCDLTYEEARLSLYGAVQTCLKKLPYKGDVNGIFIETIADGKTAGCTFG